MTYSLGKSYILTFMLLLWTEVQAVDLLVVGSPLPALVQIKDQHDRVITMPNNLQRVMVAADNAGASLVTAFLDAQEPTWLETQRTLYLADIHKMPSLISRMFALPKLRDKPYSIALGREETDLAAFPRQKGCVTLMRLTESKIGTIDFACSEDALKTALAP